LGLEDERLARIIVEKLEEEDLEGIQFRNLYKALDAALKKHIDITHLDFTGAEGDTEYGKLFSEIALIDPPPGPPEDFIRDTTLWLKKMSLRDELDLLKGRLSELGSRAGGRSDAEEMEIVEAYRKISRELKKMGLKEDT
jgi:hypothetical protein